MDKAEHPADHPAGPLILTVAVSLVVAVWLFIAASSADSRMPYNDFVEYYAAGKLLADGRSPYNVYLVAEEEAKLGRAGDFILMWNPPYSLPLVLPLGYLPPRAAFGLWVTGNFLAVVVAVILLHRAYRLPELWLPAVVAAGVMFSPSLSGIVMGQVSPLLLLGAAGFVWAVRGGRDFLAGVLAALMGVKPHLMWLFWPALLVWTVRTRRFNVVLGGVVAGVALTAVAVAWRPEVWSDYVTTLRGKDVGEGPRAGRLAEYDSPTAGAILRLALGKDKMPFEWQFVTVMPGLVWLAWYLRRTGGAAAWTEAMPPLLIASVLTATYGAWLFDLVIHVAVLVALAARLRASGSEDVLARGLMAMLLAVAALLAQLAVGMPQLAFAWVTPALAVGWWVAGKYVPEGPGPTSAG